MEKLVSWSVASWLDEVLLTEVIGHELLNSLLMLAAICLVLALFYGLVQNI